MGSLRAPYPPAHYSMFKLFLYWRNNLIRCVKSYFYDIYTSAFRKRKNRSYPDKIVIRLAKMFLTEEQSRLIDMNSSRQLVGIGVPYGLCSGIKIGKIPHSVFLDPWFSDLTSWEYNHSSSVYGTLGFN